MSIELAPLVSAASADGLMICPRRDAKDNHQSYLDRTRCNPGSAYGLPEREQR
jgi:hypothetical protein